VDMGIGQRRLSRAEGTDPLTLVCTIDANYGGDCFMNGPGDFPCDAGKTQ
jgi:hypothetical protein